MRGPQPQTQPGRWSRLHRGTIAGALALALIGGFEGLRRTSYLDVVGVPTICYGSTRGVELGVTKSRDECDELLLADALEHEAGMRACLKAPDALPPETYVAFLSFTFNLGVGAFCGSTLRKKLDAGDIRGACDELPKWNKAGGREIAGLTTRRAKERELCHEGLTRKQSRAGLSPAGFARAASAALERKTDVRLDLRRLALVVGGAAGGGRAAAGRLVLPAVAQARARAARRARGRVLDPQERRARRAGRHRGAVEAGRAGDAR